MKNINRKTDSLLDWLGNWGGFLDGLNTIGKNLLSPYTLYTLKSTLAFFIVRFIPSKVDNKMKKNRKNTFISRYFNS